MSKSGGHSNSNSFAAEREAKHLPWFFRHAMAEPVTLVTGI